MSDQLRDQRPGGSAARTSCFANACASASSAEGYVRLATIPHLACMPAAAVSYGLPPRVLPAIRALEGGEVGIASRNADDSENLGVMQVDTRWLAPLARLPALPEAAWRERLVGDA